MVRVLLMERDCVSPGFVHGGAHFASLLRGSVDSATHLHNFEIALQQRNASKFVMMVALCRSPPCCEHWAANQVLVQKLRSLEKDNGALLEEIHIIKEQYGQQLN